jgi:glycosyltransferase involved in cell wall biosynthesis
MIKKVDTNLSITTKHPGIILTVLAFWFIIIGMVIWHWLYLYRTPDFPFAYLAIANFLIWWIALLWGIHHMLFQLLALFKKPNTLNVSNPPTPKIAILYITCDDFNHESCQSCCDQEYPNAQVYICDDSQTNECKKQIDEFCNKHPSCQLTRRDTLTGFKAGNLNHAIQNKVKEEWMLLVDADQFLPEKYLVNLAKNIPGEDPYVAFIQSAHDAKSFRPASYFQKAMEPEVAMFYTRSLSVRQKFGFVPMLGHGALVRRSSWDEVGKFPEIVSEDFAFAIEIASKNKRGIYVEDVKGFEEYPHDFGGFMIRVRKWAGGTAELLKWRHLRYRTLSFIENWDFGMQILGYIIAPFIFLNSFLGSYVLHKLWNEYTILLNPSLPYLYTFLLLVTLTIITSISKNIGQVVVFYFWATAIYTASLPIIGFTFLKHLFISPSFRRTPKNGTNTPLGFWESVLMMLFGCITLGLANYWFSPFSYVLYGVGSAYLSYPLLGQLSSTSWLGKLSRVVVYLPGSFMVYALYAMWIYGRY